MYTIIKPKSHDEWLKVRAAGIGSSEVGTILNLNPFETAYQLWRRKKGLDAPKVETFAMKAGHYLEDAVSRFYADETGACIIKSSEGDWIIRDNKRPYRQVSPDRTFWREGDTHNKNNKGILECKTTQREIDADNLPDHWLVQVMYQLGVARMDHGAIAWLTQGREFGYQTITFDADLYGWLTEEIEKFWTDYIIGDAEPDCVNVADVMLKYPRHRDGKSVTAPEEIVEQLERLQELKATIKTADDAKKEIEKAIKVVMGDGEMLVDASGKTLATWRSAADSQKFDEAAFKAEHADLYNQYVKPVAGSRRFLTK